jgi:hypothetical protein
VDRPSIENTPGIVWRERKDGWSGVWLARTDLIKRGYLPRSVTVWSGNDMTEVDKQLISDKCVQLQNEMLVWGRGGVPTVSQYDGTIAGLIRCYQTDEYSTYRKLRYKSRVFYTTLCGILMRDHSDARVADIKGRTILEWYNGWTDAGEKIAMGHAMIGMVRTLMTFGKTMLEDEACTKLQSILSDMRFTMAKARTERLTAEQANAIRHKAHEMVMPMIALAQAFQFECMLRQKDVIGEWVPQNEPGLSDTMDDEGFKWLRGIRWQEIDSNLVLRHVTSKRQKEIQVNLNLAPMVAEELAKLGRLPSSGPIIIDEANGLPYRAQQFRTEWRRIAKWAGVPAWIRNMDSRAGAISEATDAGAQLEHVRHAATHGDISMTQRYSRGAAEKIEEVQKARMAHRNKTSKEQSD